MLQRIRYAIHDHDRAYLTVFNSTPLERRLAVLLGIPLNGLDPSLVHLVEIRSRRVFKQAGVEMPAGVETSTRPRKQPRRSASSSGSAHR